MTVTAWLLTLFYSAVTRLNLRSQFGIVSTHSQISIRFPTVDWRGEFSSLSQMLIFSDSYRIGYEHYSAVPYWRATALALFDCRWSTIRKCPHKCHSTKEFNSSMEHGSRVLHTNCSDESGFWLWEGVLSPTSEIYPEDRLFKLVKRVQWIPRLIWFWLKYQIKPKLDWIIKILPWLNQTKISTKLN